MAFDDSKYYPCPIDGDDAILLVDVETETIPVTDEDGNTLYYCPEGEHVFATNGDKALI
jgi:hypothetical protein